MKRKSSFLDLFDSISYILIEEYLTRSVRVVNNNNGGKASLGSVGIHKPLILAQR